jgi:hypothetical protein
MLQECRLKISKEAVDALESRSGSTGAATVRETLECVSQATLELSGKICAMVSNKQSLRKAAVEEIGGKGGQRPRFNSGFRRYAIQMQQGHRNRLRGRRFV